MRIRIKVLFLLVICTGLPQILLAQNSSEESFVTNYPDKFLLRLYTITKFNSLSINNPDLEKSLDLLPNGQTNLGIGFNYKGLGLGIAFGVPISQGSGAKYVNTERLDIQGNLYGRKFGGDGFFQIYQGYYNSNPDDFVEWNSESFPKLQTMRILSLGVTGNFFLNHERFSYRAAFVRDEIQNKSEGSFILGFFGNYDKSTTNSGYVPAEFPDSLQNALDLKGFRAFAIGASVGYAHTFVIKRFFISLTAIPGFGYQNVEITDIQGQTRSDKQPAGQVLVKSSLGYEHPFFFLGLFGSVNFRNLDIEPYDFELATEQFRFVVGKRF